MKKVLLSGFSTHGYKSLSINHFFLNEILLGFLQIENVNKAAGGFMEYEY